MKRILKFILKLSSIVLIAIILLFPQSCGKEYLNITPESVFASEKVFTDIYFTRLAILGIYQLMTNDEGYSKRLSMYYGVDTDIAMCSGPSLDNGRRDIARYACTPGNMEILKPWRNLYMGIERANICIEGIPKSPLLTDGKESERKEMNRMLGEVYTLRALHYYELIRNWGDVPFKTKPSEAGDITKFYLPKTDRDTIYEHLINDLLYAETLVPWRSEVPSDERITKGAVKGLLARIALARAGYSLRRGSGVMEQGSNPQKYYQIARDQCNDIMESGEHSLNPDFEEVFKTMCRRQLDVDFGEVMWEVGMGNYESGETGYYIGNKIDANSSYGKADGGVRAMAGFYYSFNAFDTRRDVTVSLYRIDDQDNQVLESLDAIYLAKWRREWLEPIQPGADKYNGINWVLLRYSDILLMFAESENELNNGPTPAAIAAYEEVRRRAFRGNEDQIGITPTDYQGFFNAIVNERAWELAGECLRKHDLIRWNLLDSKISEMRSELREIYNQQGIYQNVPQWIAWKNVGKEMVLMNFNNPLDSLTIAARDTIEWPNVTNWAINLDEEFVTWVAKYFEPNSKELLPIHQEEIDVNPYLTNDYGY